jgi:hypothetical protein
MKRTFTISRYTSEANLKALIVFCISAILAFLFVPNKWLDLYRYYGEAAKINIDQSLFAYIKQIYLSNFDFIYYVLLFVCKRLSLPVQLVTAFSVGLFYSQALILINTFQEKFEYRLSIYTRIFVEIAALSSVSFILVFSLSRNITALVFLFFGLINLMKGKKRAYVYFLIACFTHLVLIPYLSLFLIVYYLNKYFPKEKFKRQILIIILTIICIYSLPIMNYFFHQISYLPFFEHYQRYMDYLMFRRRETFSFLGKWDILMFYTDAFIIIFGLFLIRKYNSLLWVAYIFYLFLVVSISFSVTLTQRTVIILVPLQGLVASAFLSQKNKPFLISVFILLMLISMMLFTINVYSYRDYLHFSFPPL